MLAWDRRARTPLRKGAGWCAMTLPPLLLSLGCTLHVLENGLSGKPQPTSQVPESEKPEHPPTPPISDAIWRDPSVQVGVFGLIVAIGNHFSRKSAAKRVGAS